MVLLVVVPAVLSLVACIATKPGSGGGNQTQTSVTVTPNPQAVAVGTTQQFAAVVSGSSDQTVTWSVAPQTGENCSAATAYGSISSTGLYTAPVPPATIPASPCFLVVTATSSANNTTTTGQALVSLHVVTTISPTTDTIGQGANLQFTSNVLGASSANQGVQWSASGGGSFDNQAVNPGLYIATALSTGVTSATVNITATSTFDSNQTGNGTLTVVQNDPLGTATPSSATAASITCPNFTAGLPASSSSCYQLNVTCDQIANQSVYLKVNNPVGASIGTVIFGTDAGGSTLYDNDPDFMDLPNNYGNTVVQGILNFGYTTVQVSFGAPFVSTNPNGWLQGPGGVRRLACRYATVADWVYKNINNSSTTLPMCATGNGGGSGAIGYAVTEYGLASEFQAIEQTSGPVMTKIHQGCAVCGSYIGSDPCIGAQENMCYAVGSGPGVTASTLDSAYQASGQSTPTLCTNAVNGTDLNNGSSEQFNRFLSDSIEDDPNRTIPIPIPNPPTYVQVLLGADDGSNAVPQGFTWWTGVSPTPLPYNCVASAPEAIPSTNGGANQIIDDISTNCKMH